MFSIMFVFAYFIYHLKSLFLAFMGITMILFSFPAAVMVSNGILRVSFFSSLHSLTMFIVLGIAADDIFVFIDAWRQSKHIKVFNNDNHKRMAYTFRRASRAMAVTSSTTSVAFFANFFSPIMPIKSFGIFAGVIVPMNFFLVVLIFPAAVIVYESKIEPFCASKFKCCAKKDVESEKPEEDSALEKFFGNQWNDGVKMLKFPIIIITIIWLVVAGYFASKLGPLTEQEKFVDDSHPVQRPLTVLANDFNTRSDSKPSV